MNGAYFETDFSAHGWLIDDGHELQPKFEASPHHVFAVKGAEAFGGRWESLGFEPELALKNFPLLVENGAARVKDNGDPGNPRTFVCDSGGGIVHLVVVLPTDTQGPTLFEIAHLAELSSAVGGFGCRSVVNLDGGPSSGYWLAASTGVPSAEPPVRIGHALAIVPRAL